MRVRRVVCALLLASCLTAAGSDAQELDAKHPPAATHPSAGVRLDATAAGRQYEVSVPGRLLDWLIIGGPPARIFLLAAPEGVERHVFYRVDLATEELRPLRSDLDPAFDRLRAVDLDGDGVDEVLIGRPGRLFHLAPLDGRRPPESTLVFSAPGVDLAAALDDHLDRGLEARQRLDIPAVGLLRRFGPTADGWGLVDRHPLPTRADRHGHGLRLTTPPVSLLEPADGPVLAIGPEAVGDRRLRSLLTTGPAGGSSADERVVWSRLPGPERLQRSWLTTLDGRPILIVATNSADKLGVLERQSLRLFSLYDDRTQAGVGPWLARRTVSRRWQPIEPIVTDVDGDGDEDLALIQIEGLGSGKVVIEAILNNGRRGFEPRSRSTKLDRESSGWSFERDLTGDGLVDLVLLSEGTLEVYPTLPRGSRLVAPKPLWSFAGAEIAREGTSVEIGTEGVVVSDDRPERTGRPAVIDLDGDGRDEIVLAENPAWGFGRLRIVFLQPLGAHVGRR